MATDHVSIGTLKRMRQLIEVGCDRCSHVVCVNPRVLPFHGLTTEDAYQLMRGYPERLIFNSSLVANRDFR